MATASRKKAKFLIRMLCNGVITLRYLASGNSQQLESFNFRVGRSTVCMIIYQTCNAIWIALHQHYLRFPASQEEWKCIANGFKNEWNFPTCLGALDGNILLLNVPKTKVPISIIIRDSTA